LVTARADRLKWAGRRSRYRTRKQTVEPVFGQIKQARGFRQFLLRDLDKVRGEWAMICIAHYLLKLASVLSARAKSGPSQTMPIIKRMACDRYSDRLLTVHSHSAIAPSHESRSDWRPAAAATAECSSQSCRPSLPPQSTHKIARL